MKNKTPEKPRISESKAIELLLIEKERGAIYKDAHRSILSNFKLSEPTFAKYWKKATEIYEARQAKIQEELTKTSAEKQKEALTEAILTRAERMQIASDIARGKAWRVGDSVIAPNAGERLRALDYLSKIDGDYAATKVDAKVTPVLDITELTPEQITAIEEAGDILFGN